MSSFDYVIGDGQKILPHFDAERLRSAAVDHELETRRPPERGLFALLQTRTQRHHGGAGARLFGAVSAARTQRVLGAWEKLRRAVARLLVAGTAAQDLLLRAKHLLLGAIVACRRAAGTIS
jgi:hypothetical protein